MHKHKGSGPHRHSHVALAVRSRSKGPPIFYPLWDPEATLSAVWPSAGGSKTNISTWA